ncbi:MAG: citrate lyase subunit alpha [Peptococcaceae bacterium]|nr:citrate lyase subunit alpha [Peptococcaceae bacterium]
MKNAVGREIPDFLEGYGQIKPFKGAFATIPTIRKYAPKVKITAPGASKLVDSLEAVFKKIPIQNGMTLSFHHHHRDGERLMGQVLAVAEKLGLKDLGLSVTGGPFPFHEFLIDYMKSGIITSLVTSGIYGSVAKAVSQGVLAKPTILHTHGGRPRKVQAGELQVDVTFIAAPSADENGNLTGAVGPSACGSLGYSFADAEYAGTVVAVTDNIVPFPLTRISIPQTQVDYVVKVEQCGDPNGIVSGTTRKTTDPAKLEMAETCANVIKASGLLKEGFSFQTGAGGPSLAAAHFVSEMMQKDQIQGSFCAGGIHAYLVEMLEMGLFKAAFDVQSFDLQTVESMAKNPNHIEISADFYANPFNNGCIVHQLDTVILGATEVDVDFNVNVVSGSNGVIMGGSGGHSDTAAGAKMTIIATNLTRGGKYPIVMDQVTTVTTPGESIDVVVTEVGVAVNPRNEELKRRLQDAGLPVKDIQELKKIAEDTVGVPGKPRQDGRIVGVVEYRDGTVIDVVREV